MNATVLAALTPAERHLVSEADAANLATLDEDAALALQDRLRRARNKQVGLYRRGGARQVAEKGGRGKAKQQNQQAALKAEAFEDALARVSRRVAALARESAAALKAERIAAARGTTTTARPAASARAKAGSPRARATAGTPVRKVKRNADTLAQGQRRQARRDAKGR